MEISWYLFFWQLDALILSNFREPSSRTPKTSPGFNLYDGIFTTLPFTITCLCETNCLAPFLVEEMLKRYTVLSNLASKIGIKLHQ